MTEMRTAVADFAITAWDVQEQEDDGTPGAAIGHTIVRKRFSGAVDGESETQLLTAVGSGGRGYVAVERVQATLDGRAGSFVLLHGGIDGDGDVMTFGVILAGSGTGDLTDLRGTGTYVHAGEVARLTLEYRLE
jgi:hypothetical protein